MSGDVGLVEVDDVVDARLRGDLLPPMAVAPGFPRTEDREVLRTRGRGAVVFLVVDDGVVVGTCGTHGPPGSDGAIELGWGLVESARGRGVGGRAVEAMVALVVAGQPGVPLVAHTEWRCHATGLLADSPASEAILRRLGFDGAPEPAEAGYRAWRRTS